MLSNSSSVLRYPQASFAFVSFVFWTFFAASSSPTPLYQIYQSSWGFSSLTLTVIFAAYALGMLTSLLIAGSISDFVGRKPVLAFAIFIEIIAMLVFLNANSASHLLVARLCQGVATGMATAVLGAFLLDINSSKASIYSSIVPLCGVGCGVVTTSLLVDYASNPLQLIFIVLTVGLVVQLIVLFLLDEPVARRPGGFHALRPSLGLPSSARQMFFIILPMNTAVWSLNGFFLSLVPSLVKVSTASGSALSSGLVVGLMSFAGAAAVQVLKRHTPEFNMRLGAVLLGCGVLGILSAVYSGLTALFYIFTIVAGVGAGASFISFNRCLLPLSPIDGRAGLISAYYVVSQLALIIPCIGIGGLIQYVGLTAATYCYGGVVLVLLGVSSYLMIRRDHKVSKL